MTRGGNILVAIVLVVFLAGAGVVGFVYLQKQKSPLLPTFSDESNYRSLLRKCGDIPGKVPVDNQKFHLQTGPFWSPDCKHIAWSLIISGPSWDGPVPAGEEQEAFGSSETSSEEGVFLYNVQRQETRKIYSPKLEQDNAVLVGWSDNSHFSYKFSYKTDAATVAYEVIN